jgi:hypothetical protein
VLKESFACAMFIDILRDPDSLSTRAANPFIYPIAFRLGRLQTFTPDAQVSLSLFE